MLNGTPYISEKRATTKAEKAARVRQSRPLDGWKKPTAKTITSSESIATRPHNP